MSPSNMELRIGTFQDYNNKIVIATEGLTLGLNDGANTKPIPPKTTSTVEGTKTKQSHLEPDTTSSYRKQEHPDQPLSYSEQHEKNKTALIVGCIVAGLTALIIYEIY